MGDVTRKEIKEGRQKQRFRMALRVLNVLQDIDNNSLFDRDALFNDGFY